MGTTINFGKYKGQDVESIRDRKYLFWLTTANDRDKDDPKAFKIPQNVVDAAKKMLQAGKSGASSGKDFTAMLEAQIQAQNTAINDSDDPGTYYYGVLEGLETALRLWKECNGN